MRSKFQVALLTALMCFAVAAIPVGAWVICTDVGVNNELIDNNTDGMIDFAGRGGSDNTDIRFDLDGTSPTISSPTDGVITIAEALSIGGALYPTSADGGALGSATLEWSDLFLADGAYIKFGADQDVTLLHVADTGLQMELDDKLMFGDTAVYVFSNDDGYLDLVADTGVRISGATAVTGTFSASGTATLSAAVVHSSETVTCSGDAGTAAVTKTVSYIVTDGGGDTNEDTVSLADGVSGQMKIFVYKTETDAGDSANVTPSNGAFTKIVFDAPGEGCTMIFDGTNWSIVSNNGGTIT